ncbi:MAG: S41 family peptidase [Bacteroidota bacterium]
MKYVFLTIIALYISCGHSQSEIRKFNLDFEDNTQNKSLPNGWLKWGDYELSKDSTTVHSGIFSSKISAESGSSFGSIAYKIPSKYRGKKITLEGYMKLENVSGGHAGLLLRMDGESDVLEFDNMQSQGISGTSDWKKYSITLPFNRKTKNIYVAGILKGSGVVWFDGFKVTIDGRDIQKLKETKKQKRKGEFTNSFDNGSFVDFGQLTEDKITDLELLGRIWGFLKYHHPAIAKGRYNWDDELFQILPDYLDLTNRENRDSILSQWIASYGKVKRCKNCRPIDPEAFLKPNFDWFGKYDISKTLSGQLKYIQENRFQGNHHYVDFDSIVGSPKFKNEKSYPNMPYPDAGFRLLTLFRFWNMIEYFFPYKHLTDMPWSAVMKKYMVPFIAAKNELEFELIALQLIGEVKDTHANLWSGDNGIQKWKGSYYPPFHIRFIENRAVVTDYYNPELQRVSKLKVGDIINGINGKSTDQIIEERLKFYPGSNRASQLRDIGEELLRSQDSVLTLTYESEGVVSKHQLKLYGDKELNRYRWYKKEPNEKSYRWLDSDIGYITLKNIKDSDIEPIQNNFLNAKGIVIDIRNYPSFFVVFELGQFFINRPTAFARFSRANKNTPGEFILDKRVTIFPGKNRFKGKLVILVNELSQSQSEFTAMAFRAAPNCIIIGSTTAGADGNVSRIGLPGAMGSMISGIGVHYPDGSETQRIGIVPDIEIKPTIEGIKNGRDELLEKAIELIKTTN